MQGGRNNVLDLNVIRLQRRKRAGWTVGEHMALVRLAQHIGAELEMGRADDGAPWANLGNYSVVCEHGIVAVLDAEGQPVVAADSVQEAIKGFEATWWGNRERTA